MRVEKIKNAATKFRLAIEGLDRSQLSDGFSRFPWGACSDASLLLAAFLKDEGFGTFELVSAHGKAGTHAWLQQDGIVIDITADQFTDFDAAVYVGDDHWHRQFEEHRNSEPADYRRYDNKTISILDRDYTLLKGRTWTHVPVRAVGL
jgi:hypothetical protein